MTQSGIIGARLRRFYKTVAVGEAEGGGYVVLLDGKRLKTPAGTPLVLESRRLAEALAVEWEAQSGEIRPLEMPLMRFLSTAIDRVTDQREAVIDEIAAFAATDLLCYRVGHPAELAHRQQVHWQPLVDWAILQYDAPLSVTSGILPLRQSEAALAALRAAVSRLDPFTLTGLQAVVTVTGSLIVGLALLDGRISVEEAWVAGQLEESWQVERWGEDEEAARRRARLKADLEDAARFLELLRD